MSGNAAVLLVDGNISGSGIAKAVNVTDRNVVTVVAAANDRLVFNLRQKYIRPNNPDIGSYSINGLFNGTFTHDVSYRSMTFHGVILQKQEFGAGYFLGTTEAGAVTITPRP